MFLTGANGVMGTSAIAALRAEGHSVVGLARTAQTAKVVAELGAEPWLGDLYDGAALAAGMSGCDAVVNFATKVPVGRMAAISYGAFKAHDRLRIEGARVATEAAQRAGVPRFIQQSVSFVYADHGDEWIDEDSSISVTRFAEPVVVAETHVRNFSLTGGTGIVLRFGLIAGPDAHSGWLLRRARAGKPLGLGRRDAWCHVVHVDDVGTAAAAALGAPAGIFNVGATPISRGDFADAYAHAVGRPGGELYGRMMQHVAGHKIEWLSRSQRVSSRRFGAVTGWHPRHDTVNPGWFDELVRQR